MTIIEVLESDAALFGFITVFDRLLQFQRVIYQRPQRGRQLVQRRFRQSLLIQPPGDGAAALQQLQLQISRQAGAGAPLPLSILAAQGFFVSLPAL